MGELVGNNIGDPVLVLLVGLFGIEQDCGGSLESQRNYHTDRLCDAHL